MTPESLTDNTCRKCGRSIRMQIRKNTGFCTERCEETADGSHDT